jgi:hypothetical protein
MQGGTAYGLHMCRANDRELVRLCAGMLCGTERGEALQSCWSSELVVSFGYVQIRMQPWNCMTSIVLIMPVAHACCIDPNTLVFSPHSAPHPILSHSTHTNDSLSTSDFARSTCSHTMTDTKKSWADGPYELIKPSKTGATVCVLIT